MIRKNFMNTVVLIFFVCNFLILGCNKQKNNVFSPAGSDCSIIMPGVPQAKTTLINTKYGTYTQYQYFSNENNITYSLSYARIPIELLQKKSLKIF